MQDEQEGDELSNGLREEGSSKGFTSTFSRSRFDKNGTEHIFTLAAINENGTEHILTLAAINTHTSLFNTTTSTQCHTNLTCISTNSYTLLYSLKHCHSLRTSSVTRQHQSTPHFADPATNPALPNISTKGKFYPYTFLTPLSPSHNQD